ncbi:protein of unknown function DUF6 transmembrane [Chloroherpeton thalassium ATCC 35110]|uniref:EamA domain-containing protein n=2 Tax=Chloroherpeton thalassium TaxID=100716 RepID=B3QXI4_CHLT3|nr:protein of unknown function DUF6 transmembrane [Chloroherpeton thalassium ATCC 35110]
MFPFALREKKIGEIHRIGKKNLLRLIGAIGFGGIAGPVLLLLGLQKASASSVSLWLNLELVATALLGVLFFKDHLGRYGWIGVIGTVAASLILTWHEGNIGLLALVLIGAACIAWGLDNHLTALIDGITPTQSTFWKGLVGRTTNFAFGLLFEPNSIQGNSLFLALVVGVFAYGISITLYITAAQNIGATRSQMIFGSAPFWGVILSFVFLGEQISHFQIVAIVLLIASLITLFLEQHSHPHTHEAITHKHLHHHDEHHNHPHVENPSSYHSHWHTHEKITHSHPH